MEKRPLLIDYAINKLEFDHNTLSNIEANVRPGMVCGVALSSDEIAVVERYFRAGLTRDAALDEIANHADAMAHEQHRGGKFYARKVIIQPYLFAYTALEQGATVVSIAPTVRHVEHLMNKKFESAKSIREIIKLAAASHFRSSLLDRSLLRKIHSQRPDVIIVSIYDAPYVRSNLRVKYIPCLPLNIRAAYRALSAPVKSLTRLGEKIGFNRRRAAARKRALKRGR